jgi:hypothetical protein
MWSVGLAHIQNCMPQARHSLALFQLRERLLPHLERLSVKLICTSLLHVLLSGISYTHASQNDIYQL